MSRAVFLTLAVGLAAGCGGDQSEVLVDEPAGPDFFEVAEPDPIGPPAQSAEAIFRSGSGEEVGRATLAQEGNNVAITLNVRNLEGAARAIHIHDVGRCEGPDFESAGDHFNPTNRAHGLENPAGPHAGDLPNLEPDGGIARETLRTDRVTLRPGEPHSLLGGDGTALVIHAGTDDHTSQPSGDAGDPAFCGVITPI